MSSDKNNDDDDLVWQIGSDVDSARPSTTVQHVHGRSNRSFVGIVIGAAVLVVALIGFWVYRLVTAQTAQAEIRSVLQAEEQAARDRDAEAALALTVADDPDWSAWVRALAEAGLAAPAPDPGLTATDAALETTFVSLEDTTAHVRVIRTYADAQGDRFRYGFDQFYARDGTGWRRTPPSSEFWGATETFWGSRLAITFAEPDRDLVLKDLGPDIEKTLVYWCSSQPCPAEAFPIIVTLEPAYPAKYVTDGGIASGHWLSPRLAGVPVDTVSRDRYRLGLSGWIYSGVAAQTYLDASGQPDYRKIELVGVCVGAIPGARDLKACLEAGVR